MPSSPSSRTSFDSDATDMNNDVSDELSQSHSTAKKNVGDLSFPNNNSSLILFRPLSVMGIVASCLTTTTLPRFQKAKS